jgi:TonB family protein
MAEKKPCLRCERQIDAYAKICPYCNWDQANTNIPPPEAQQASVPAYVPPPERDWKRFALIGGGGFLALIAAFLVGMWINSDAAPKNAPETVAEKNANEAVRPAPRANVTLVPMNAPEQPITSAPVANPAEGIPNEYQRTDATAASSAEYAQLAAQVKAEKKRAAALVDPRSLTGPAYAQAPQQTTTSTAESESEPAPAESGAMTSAAPEAAEPERAIASTRPVPISQPLPDIRVTRNFSARLDLTIDAEGRVTDVNLRDTIPGHTGEVVAAVQRWRFRPATRNGVPVAAPFSVELLFRASE